MSLSITEERIFMAIQSEIDKHESTCLSRSVFAAIYNDDMILSLASNTVTKGVASCLMLNTCRKRNKGYSSFEGHNECVAIHAEADAIANAAKRGIRLENSKLFCTTKPCSQCAKLIVVAGIIQVKYIDDYDDDLSDFILEHADVKLIKVKEHDIYVHH